MSPDRLKCLQSLAATTICNSLHSSCWLPLHYIDSKRLYRRSAGVLLRKVHLITMNPPVGSLARRHVCDFVNQRTSPTSIRSSHLHRDRSASRNTGKIFGTLACSGQCFSQPWACIISQTPGKIYRSGKLGVLMLCSIQTWALKEAKARMEARGEKYKYEPQSSQVSS